MQLQRKVRPDFAQRLPQAVPGNAPEDRKYSGGESEDFVADVRSAKLFPIGFLVRHALA
jgi:hypothetical protein